MSDIRFNQWLHNSGTGGVSQVDGGHVGIGTTNPEIAVHSGNNKILNVGIVTATTYYGDGSNLTGITDNVVNINNNADNKIITGSGSANTLEAEANLTFSGSTLKVNSTTGHSFLKINSNDSYSGTIHFGDQSDDDAAQIWYDNYQGNGMYLRTSENTPISFYTNNTPRLRLTNGGDLTFLNSNADATAGLNSIIFSNNSGEVSRIRGESRNGNTNGMITFHTDISGSSAERMRVNHDGAFCFGNDSARPAEFNQPNGFSLRWDDKGQFQSSVTDTTCGLLNRKGTDGDILSFRKAGTGVGHIGVTASTMYLNFNGSSVAANQLDDYEEGTWTPDFRVHNYLNNANSFTYSHRSGFYTKIGRQVHVTAYFVVSNFHTYTGNLYLFGLPFAPASGQQPVLIMVGDHANFSGTDQMGMFVIVEGGNSRGVVGHQKLGGWSHMTRSEMDGGGGYISGSFYV